MAGPLSDFDPLVARTIVIGAICFSFAVGPTVGNIPSTVRFGAAIPGTLRVLKVDPKGPCVDLEPGSLQQNGSRCPGVRFRDDTLAPVTRPAFRGSPTIRTGSHLRVIAI
jgi:hypothetical protein